MGRGKFQQIERALWIDGQVRAGKYPNAGTIAKELEVDRKTVQRTLEFMRDRWEFPLEYSAQQRGWFYTAKAFPLPMVTLSEGEVAAILLASALARHFSGFPTGGQISAALAKVVSALTESMSLDLGDLNALHSFESAPATESDIETFRKLEWALATRHRIEMDYYTATRNEWNVRRVDALHLRNKDGDWYLIAFDHKRGEVRDFLLHRMRSVQMLDETFTPLEGFDLDAYLASGFQMIRGGEPVEVVLEFDEYQARWIRERQPPHPSGRFEEFEGGRLRLTMTVTSIESVRRYVLQYGAHVTVVAPEELRREMSVEARRLYAMYPDA